MGTEKLLKMIYQIGFNKKISNEGAYNLQEVILDKKPHIENCKETY